MFFLFCFVVQVCFHIWTRWPTDDSHVGSDWSSDALFFGEVCVIRLPFRLFLLTDRFYWHKSLCCDLIVLFERILVRLRLWTDFLRNSFDDNTIWNDQFWILSNYEQNWAKLSKTEHNAFPMKSTTTTLSGQWGKTNFFEKSISRFVSEPLRKCSMGRNCGIWFFPIEFFGMTK